jgi:hypothetical protein
MPHKRGWVGGVGELNLIELCLFLVLVELSFCLCNLCIITLFECY